MRHIHVLRLNAGDAITLFNGTGNDFDATLQEIGKRHAECHITAQRQPENESPLAITLVQAISSGERMDFTLQKSVELGVHAIQPIISERCVVRLSGERAEKRVQRWQDIVIAACEQSGRSVVPTVLPIVSFNDYLRQMPPELHLMMSLRRATTLRDIAPAPQTLRLMIGPEGGWTPAEEQVALEAGVQTITLGKRVLRTETAAMAAMAAMQVLWGDF